MVGEGAFFSGRKSRLSQTIANTKTWTIDTAAILATLPKKAGMPMIPTTTGGIYTKNVPVFYSVDEDGSNIPFGMKKHYHVDDTDVNGGIFNQLQFKNAGLMVPWYNYQFHPSNWIEEKTGTGAGFVLTTGTSTAQLDLVAGTSANGYNNMRVPSGLYRLNEDSILQMKIQYDGATLFTNYLMRFGVNCEMINNANDPNSVSYGIEACPADAKALAFSADGAGARSTLPTVFNNDETAHIWLLRHLPTVPNIQVTRDTDFTGANILDKGTEVPVAGTTSSGRVVSWGIKSTVSSASKKIIFRGAVFLGVPEGSWKWQFTEF